MTEMQFTDISTDKNSTYVLKQDEKVVFFLFNRSGEVTFELTGKGAEAHIFVLHLTHKQILDITIHQKHVAPHATSHVKARSVIKNESEASYAGRIFIDQQAIGSIATQESRALLLSQDAKHRAIPSLEILPRDVLCHHKATAAPLNQESLFYLESRGLNKEESTRILVEGFVMNIFEEMSDLGVPFPQLEPVIKTITKQIAYA